MGDAFAGLVVLDLSRRPSGAWCTRLLADFGADVIVAEPPQGHPLRRMGPFGPDGTSALAAYLLANKQSVVLSSPDDRETLLRRAHVLVDDTLPGDVFDYPQAAQINPNLIVCSITPYGQDGARATLPGNDLTVNALSGWASVNGLADREPLKGSGYQASYQAGTMAYGAIVCALIKQRANCTGGQHIDIAELEVMCATFAPALLRSQLQGEAQKRRSQIDITSGPVPVRDGYFSLPLTRPHFWRLAMELLDLPELAHDEMLQKTWYRLLHKDQFVDRVQATMHNWTRQDLFDRLAELRVIAGPVLTVGELGDNPQLQTRGFFTQPEQPEARDIAYPGAPAQFSASPWRLRRGLPLLGEHQERLEATAPTQTVRPARSPQPHGPLSGYRGIVLTQAWAGTFATELLAFMGADVIQLETHTRLDSWRGAPDSPMPSALDGRTSARHPWNCNPNFNSVNLNKQSITLDLSRAEGIAIFKQLLPHADFVAENFAPRVMGKLGIGYEVMREIKPDIILCSLSGYGHTGPWSHVPAIGGTCEPSSGMSALLGYGDGQPLNSGLMYPDAVAGLYGFGALATALYHRERTGEGQFIDLSMQEANFTFIGDAWIEYALTGQVRGGMGNRHATQAPHGMYPCQGEDQWVAIAVEDDRQWQALCALANEVAALREARFETQAGRKQHEAALDAMLSEWARTQDRHDVAARLCAAGIPAAPVLNALEVAADAALTERGQLVRVDHPETGPWVQAGVPARFSHTPPGVQGPAPLLGQHATEVFDRLLGMSTDAYEALYAEGITGTVPPSTTLST